MFCFVHVLKIAMANQGFLWLHKNFSSISFSFVKNAIAILIEVALNL